MFSESSISKSQHFYVDYGREAGAGLGQPYIASQASQCLRLRQCAALETTREVEVTGDKCAQMGVSKNGKGHS